jgi:hypothetical protein
MGPCLALRQLPTAIDLATVTSSDDDTLGNRKNRRPRVATTGEAVWQDRSSIRLTSYITCLVVQPRQQLGLRSAVLISRLKNTVDWFVMREKYCSGWKNKLRKTDYKRDEQGLETVKASINFDPLEQRCAGQRKQMFSSSVLLACLIERLLLDLYLSLSSGRPGCLLCFFQERCLIGS